METNTGPIPRQVTKEGAPCCICRDPSRLVDLTKACMIWPRGQVAHVGCYNDARLAAKGRPAEQTALLPLRLL